MKKKLKFNRILWIGFVFLAALMILLPNKATLQLRPPRIENLPQMEDYQREGNPKMESVLYRLMKIYFNVVLFTEDNFGGWAVPIRKGRDALLAEQISPNFKSWHFKSMKMKSGSKLRLKAIIPDKKNTVLLGAIDFTNQGYGSVPNINTLIQSHSTIKSSKFAEIFLQSNPNRRYYIQELY